MQEVSCGEQIGGGKKFISYDISYEMLTIDVLNILKRSEYYVMLDKIRQIVYKYR